MEVSEEKREGEKQEEMRSEEKKRNSKGRVIRNCC